ncbi:MAG: hypothetical protein A2W93_02225 [Bacteroidetes bacterium GWF2_43_63]|nr:MAG: hypothetical protein A2W93_02225 [Bacteroidetes bacterium GWF2_43_63]HBG69281.1 hypothetical protein [Bacteroidales bacterium]HCB60335.1 hypothetical protein [Bacteroidales bacterium]HCY23678.1 hypothetical protein [Bacteroidales bacterium]
MIKYDGYYLAVPTPYTDYVAGSNKRTGFIHWAYFFNANGIVKRKRKESKNGKVAFKKEDFESAISGEFILNGDFVNIIFDKGQKWELKKSFRVKEIQLICVESNSAAGIDEIYQFHNW